MKAHAGIKGNVKADLLAKRGQYEVCAIGRYSADLVNPVSSLQPFNSPQKQSEAKNSFSLNNISKNLADMESDNKDSKHETTNNHNFSEANLDSCSSLHHSPSLTLSSSASSSPGV